MKEENTSGGGFASWFNPVSSLIGTVVGGVTSLLGKNAEVEKAKAEVDVAKQALLVEQQKTKQAGYAVDVAKLDLLKAKEATAQKRLDDETALAKQKQSIGLATLLGVLVFVFGIGYLFVKFVLPVFYSKPQAPSNIVIQE